MITLADFKQKLRSVESTLAEAAENDSPAIAEEAEPIIADLVSAYSDLLDHVVWTRVQAVIPAVYPCSVQAARRSTDPMDSTGWVVAEGLITSEAEFRQIMTEFAFTHWRFFDLPEDEQ